MKILIAGCSFCLEVDHILRQKMPGCRITNLSHAAAGNKFIADSVIAATARENFDLIYVSWSGLSRYDAVIDDDTYFHDWMAKGSLYSKNYVFTGGIGSWDHQKHEYANMIFTGIHKFVDQEQLHYLSLLEMLKIQHYLDSLNVPHYFSIIINQFNEVLIDPALKETSEISARNFPENNILIEKLNIQNWILNEGLGEFEACYNKNLISNDRFHPTIQGYEYWMELLCQRLKKDNII
jgi:hypothetical protein